jgi:ferrochelatase
VPIDHICCYPGNEGFIGAVAELVRNTYDGECAKSAVPTHPGGGAAPYPRVIFTAHSLPEKIIAAGDPYQWQVEKTAALIAARTEIPGLDWKLAYQSRLGPLKWIGPNIDTVIRRAGRDGVPVIVAPIAFVSEHVETLVELDHDMRKVAEEAGVPRFCRVPAVGTHALYIKSLARLAAGCRQPVCSDLGGRICPVSFGKCPNALIPAVKP